MNPAERAALQSDVEAEIVRTLPTKEQRDEYAKFLQGAGMTAAAANQKFDDCWAGDYEAREAMRYWLLAHAIGDPAWWAAVERMVDDGKSSANHAQSRGEKPSRGDAYERAQAHAPGIQ